LLGYNLVQYQGKPMWNIGKNPLEESNTVACAYILPLLPLATHQNQYHCYPEHYCHLQSMYHPTKLLKYSSLLPSSWYNIQSNNHAMDILQNAPVFLVLLITIWIQLNPILHVHNNSPVFLPLVQPLQSIPCMTQDIV